MSITSVRRMIFCALLSVTIVGLSAQLSLAQDSTPTQRAPARDDQTNLDLELYLIAGTNHPREGKIPAALDGLVKQLRETLPFKNYSLETTLVNRVKDGGNLSVGWLVGALPGVATSNRPPMFNDFSIGQVRLVVDGKGGQVIQMLRFSFGLRIPIQTSTNIAASGTSSAPVFSYDYVGLKTDISVREGQPAVVGTLLTASSSGEALVLALVVKRPAN